MLEWNRCAGRTPELKRKRQQELEAVLPEAEALAKAEAEAADTRTGSGRESCAAYSDGLLWSHVLWAGALRGVSPQRGERKTAGSFIPWRLQRGGRLPPTACVVTESNRSGKGLMA